MLHLGFAEQNGSGSGVDPALAAAAEAEQAESVAHEVGATLGDLLPWGVSILLHAGVLLLAVFLFWTVQQNALNTPPFDENQSIVPDAHLGNQAGTPMKLLHHDNPTGDAAHSGDTRTLKPNDNTPPWARPTGANGPKGTGSLFGIGNRGSDTGGEKVNIWDGGSGKGDGPFDNTTIGNGGNAHRIVYIIDASGSLIEGMPFVLNELQKSIHKLVYDPADPKRQQVFTVYFAQDDRIIEVPAPNIGWKNATKENQDQTIAWLDPQQGHIVPAGKTNPMKALVQALHLNPAPDLVFILSDNFTGQGQWERSQDDLIAELKKANTSQTKINTIQFLQPDPLIRYGKQGTLERIAHETGGVYRYIDAKTLGIE